MNIRVCGFFLIAGLFGAAQASVTLDGIPPAAPGSIGRLADYLQARPARSLGFSPQGALLIRTRFGDSEQLHTIAQEGGARRQLTFGRISVDWAAFSPDPVRNAFAFLKMADDGAREQLYYQRLDEPSARLVGDGRADNFAPLWSCAGREIAYSSTERDGHSHDIVIVDPDSSALPRLIVTGDGYDWRPLDWAPDDHLLLVLQTISRSESHLFLIDLASGQRRELDPSTSPASIKEAHFAHDGQGVYYLSDAYGDYDQLRYINIFTGQKTALSERIAFDIGAMALSHDGRLLAFTSNEGSMDRLNLLDLVSHQDLIPPTLPFTGVIHGLGFDADGKRLVFSMDAPNQPEDVFVFDIAANRLTPWTRSEVGPVDSAKFVLPRLVNVPTFDHDIGRGRGIPTYVYEGVGDGKRPVLLALEAGPEQEFRPGFDPWIQYLAHEQGYTVIVPNLRGSPGYGKGYVAAGLGFQREDAVKDIGALLVWMRAQHDLDAQRVTVYGRGYGAALALAALDNFPDRVRGGVALNGISDFVEWLDTLNPDIQTERRAEYGDERDLSMRAVLRRLSPISNIARITRPLLVVQGKNDREIPLAQSEELVAVARSRSIPVWYLIANDSGHEIRGTPAEESFLRVLAQFLGSLP